MILPGTPGRNRFGPPPRADGGRADASAWGPVDTGPKAFDTRADHCSICGTPLRGRQQFYHLCRHCQARAAS